MDAPNKSSTVAPTKTHDDAANTATDNVPNFHHRLHPNCVTNPIVGIVGIFGGFVDIGGGIVSGIVMGFGGCYRG